MDNKQAIINKIKKYEIQLSGCKYIFIDNKKDVTNIIFTGSGQKYYMMISWFTDNLEYNYLYLNPIYCDYTNTDIYRQIISNCHSISYNMIGISYGGYAAIVYASMFPTLCLIIIDPARMGWNINIKSCIEKLNAMVYYHRSLHPHDIQEFIQIRDALEKTSIFHTFRCSLSEVHSGNIPNEEIILQYIQHSIALSENKCKLLMTSTKMSELSLEFLPWT